MIVSFSGKPPALPLLADEHGSKFAYGFVANQYC